MRSRSQKKRGFTIIELLVTISIFVLMTMLIISRYGAFNSGTLLTNLAYDVALSIRTAQTYGLSVKTTQIDSNSFSAAYGVHFETGTQSNRFILFADGVSPNPLDGYYQTDEVVIAYNMKQGATIPANCLYVSSDGVTFDIQATSLDITFKRPDPEAIIHAVTSPLDTTTKYKSAKITVMSNDGSVREIIVRQNGQISVGN